MAPALDVLEQRSLLLNAGDDQYDDGLGEVVEIEDAPQVVQRDAKYFSALTRCVIQLCVLMLLFDFAQFSVYAPLTAVFEEIICNHYYSSTLSHLPLSDRDCKIVPVQHELALVKGYKDAFSQIPSACRGFFCP
jgi:hypothetical protein